MRPDARPQVRKNRRRIRWNTNTMRTFQGRERRRWLRIGRRNRTVYIGQAPNSANRVLFMAGLVHRRVSRVVRGWGLIDLPLRATFSPAHPLADIFHLPYPPIASQSISRDVPLARARAFHSSLPLVRGVAEAALYCAHRTNSSIKMIPPSLLVSLSGMAPVLVPTAAVERAHSDRARSGSKGSTRVSFHPFHRARSASKKDSLAAPLPSFCDRALRAHRRSSASTPSSCFMPLRRTPAVG